MATELDYMEYSSDANAQTAFVTNASLTNILTGGTPSADLEAGGYEAAKACDGNEATWWSSGIAAFPHWWKYDFGAGVTKLVSQFKMKPYLDYGPNAFTFQGSNNNSDWTTLYSGSSSNDANWHTYTLSSIGNYRYYRMYSTTGHGLACAAYEFQMLEYPLQSYSESSIKTQGSYSLKGTASTGGVNKTLTRTIGSPIDLSGKDDLRFDIYSSRTGSNIKIGIHDSGGTTTEITPNITSANTWQTVGWDISAVADADKNAIDSIIITVVNADSANTFYIDNFLTAEDVSVTAEPFIVTTSLSSLGGIVVDGLGFVYEESTSGAVMDVSLRTNTVVMKDILHRKNLKYIYHRINSHGKDVTMTVYIDGVAQIPTFTINTTTLTTRRIEDIPDTWEGKRFDIELSCVDVTDTDLEIYAPLVMRFTSVGG